MTRPAAAISPCLLEDSPLGWDERHLIVEDCDRKAFGMVTGVGELEATVRFFRFVSEPADWQPLSRPRSPSPSTENLLEQLRSLESRVAALEAVLTPAGVEQDDSIAWLNENVSALREHEGQHVAIRGRHGIVAVATTLRELHATVEGLGVLDEVLFHFVDAAH